MKQSDFNQQLWEALRIINADKRGVLSPFANVQKKVLLLDNATNQEELRVEGDFVYADPLSTGLIGVKYNADAMPAFPFRASTGVRGFPYKTLLLNWAAQPGLVLNLWYGFGAEIIPPNQDIANIGSIGSITAAVTLAEWIGKNRVASPGFIGAESRTPVNNAEIQLFNPAASGFTVYLDKIIVSGGAGLWTFYRHTAALANAGAILRNKNLATAAAAPAAQVRWGDAVGVTGTSFAIMGANAAEALVIPYEEPIILTEGTGIHLRRSVAGGISNVMFEWRENPV